MMSPSYLAFFLPLLQFLLACFTLVVFLYQRQHASCKSFNDYYKLMEVYGANASLLCINPSTVLREVLEQVDLSTQIVYILCAIILLMNIVVISVITLLNMYDAQKEIALMRLIGISMRKIGQLYLIQNGIIGLVSTILALILSQPLGTYWT